MPAKRRSAGGFIEVRVHQRGQRRDRRRGVARPRPGSTGRSRARRAASSPRWATWRSPSPARPAARISMAAAKDFASLVSFTAGRACRPVASRITASPNTQSAGRRVGHDWKSSAVCRTAARSEPPGRLGRRHHRALDDRGVADHHPRLPLGREQLDRHLAVGLGPAEVDEDRHALRRPDALDRRGSRRHRCRARRRGCRRRGRPAPRRRPSAGPCRRRPGPRPANARR